ncbi:zinc-ribbon domain-containing protein [Sorangium sp. So ce1097]|uniref:zinc-ribbon domain-containing protein n=1 Tax=Sorangium sp. So ce1097 TaxID=3133330 RepID=UPI003F62B98C
MKITCQSCQSKYTVSDEKVQGRTVKIKCRKCGATILVNSSGVTTSGGGAADPVSGTSVPNDGTTYLVNVADGDQRSMTVAEIVATYQAGVINAETYIWADGMADWQPLGQVDTIVAALHAGSAPVSMAAQEPAPVQSQPVPSAGVAAAPASSGVEAVAASAPAPRAAAVRRDPARPTQDLFGGSPAPEAHRPSSDDVATSAPLFKSGAAPGQRDENSMLFSLSALTAKAAAPAPRSNTSASDDSGLIDLKALASGAGVRAPSPVASIVANDGGLFQLSAPIVSTARPPSVAPPTNVDTAPKNRAPIIIGAGIAIAGIAIAGVFFMMKGGGGAPAPAAVDNATTAAAPATTTPPEPEPTPTATATASATATATASAEPAASAAPTATPTAAPARAAARPARQSSGGSTAGKSQSGSSSPAPAAAPAAPKRGSCGCAPNDLMCAMQCSAKGK